MFARTATAGGKVVEASYYVPHHALPYAGPILPGHDEILVAGGYSKWGMTNGVAAALALSGRILGGHMAWSRILEPWTTGELPVASVAAVSSMPRRMKRVVLGSPLLASAVAMSDWPAMSRCYSRWSRTCT